MTHEAIEIGTVDEDEMRRAADVAMQQIARAERRKKIKHVVLGLLMVAELAIATHFLTLEEWFRWSGWGFAVGSGFAVALFGIIAVYDAVRSRRIRRRMEAWRCKRCGGTMPPFGPHACGVDLVGEGTPTVPNTWGCLDCGMRGIGPASAHVCPAEGRAERAAPNLQRKCTRCGAMVEFDAVCPCSRPAA